MGMKIDSSRVLICPNCGNRTPHKLVFEHEREETYYGEDGTPDANSPPSIYAIFECGTCHDISLYDRPAPLPFEQATLVYPRGDSLHKCVPNSVSENFREAKRIQNVSPNGFAVLVRRALEAMCDDRGVVRGPLMRRLDALAKKGEIPPVLADITSVLRGLGNAGAHSTKEKVTIPMTWAMDEFFRAVIEYVYVAPFRLEQFRKKSESISDNIAAPE